MSPTNNLANQGAAPVTSRDMKLAQQGFALAYAMNHNVFLWGDPRTGKTHTVERIGRERGVPVATTILSQTEMTDLDGFPLRVDASEEELNDPAGKAAWSPIPGMRGRYVSLVRLPPAAATTMLNAKEGVWLFDEMNVAEESKMATAMNIMSARRVAGRDLPPGIRPGAAGNPSESNRAVNDLPAAVAARFIHIEWPNRAALAEIFKVEREEPLPAWTLDEGWLESSEVKLAGLEIFEFLQLNPELEHKLDPDEVSYRGWPNIGQWLRVRDIMGASKLLGVPMETSLRLIGGCVGTPAAEALYSFRESATIPSPEQIIRNPYLLREMGTANSARVMRAASALVIAVTKEPTAERYFAARTAINDWLAIPGAPKDAMAVPLTDLLRCTPTSAPGAMELDSVPAIKAFAADMVASRQALEFN